MRWEANSPPLWFLHKRNIFLKEFSKEGKRLERKNFFLKSSLKLGFWVAKDIFIFLFLSHIPIMIMLGSLRFVTLSWSIN